jgi:hypothetical protein
MLLSSFAVILAALPLAVLGGQFPAFNGVIGGPPINVTIDKKVPETLTNVPAPKPCALRYVENSGVCGMFPLRKLLPTCVLITRQKPPLVSTQLQATRT